MNDGVYRDAMVMTGLGSGVTLLGGFVLARIHRRTVADYVGGVMLLWLDGGAA